MKLSFLSDNGLSLGIATHLSSEGHAIHFDVIGSGEGGQGLVTISTYNSKLIKGDVTIFDNPLSGRLAEDMRNEGLRVLGSSLWVELLEKDKEYKSKLVSIVGWDTTDIQTGTNLYITTWFNGVRFVSTYASLVYKRMMSGGCGPDIGQAGVVANFYQPTDLVYNKILLPLEPILKKVNHRGCFHIHLVVDNDKFSVKDIGAHFCGPLAYLLFENSKSTIAETILRLFDENSKPIQPIDQWAAAILVSTPPFPYQNPLEKPITLNPIHPAALKHFWPIDVKIEDSTWYSVDNGRLGYVTARGSKLSEATRRAYRTINNFSLADIQFRNDIGEGLDYMLRNLEKSGWIR